MGKLGIIGIFDMVLLYAILLSNITGGAIFVKL